MAILLAGLLALFFALDVQGFERGTIAQIIVKRHQLEQNRQAYSVEGADARRPNQRQPQVAVQHPFWG